MFGGYLDFVHHYIGKHLSQETQKRISYLEHQVNLGSITENQFYNHLVKEFDVHLTSKQIHDKITARMKTNKSLVAYIPKIKKSKIALFSNSLGHMASEMLLKRRLARKKIFDKVFLSNVIHMAKPAERAYHFVVEKLEVKPHEALMVDDRKENIEAAKKAGMQGIVFKNTIQFKKELKKYELV